MVALRFYNRLKDPDHKVSSKPPYPHLLPSRLLRPGILIVRNPSLPKDGFSAFSLPGDIVMKSHGRFLVQLPMRTAASTDATGATEKVPRQQGHPAIPRKLLLSRNR